MDRFTKSIRKALQDQNWFSAIFLALALPGICSALEDPPTRRRGEVSKRYKAWFNRYLKKKYDPDSLFDLMSATNPESIEKMDPDSVARLMEMPPNQECVFTAEDCYRFRCKCLHQGLIERPDGENFIFITPPPNKNVVHGNSINGRLQLQVDVFCEDMCIAVEQWVKDMVGNNAVAARCRELIEVHNYSELSPAIVISS